MEENNHTLKSELEGTLTKEERGVKPLNESNSPSPYFKYLIPTIIILLILAIVSLVFLGKDGQECLINPFLYGAEKVENEDSGALLCRCEYNSISYAPFYFNSTKITIGNYYSPLEKGGFNRPSPSPI